MSAQPIESGTRDADAEREEHPDLPLPERGGAPEQVEVRHRAAISAVLGALTSAMAIAYLWRAAGTGALLDWVLCLVLLAVAVGFFRTLLDARLPLLVADELGVRFRLGSQWRGLPWEAVDRVVVTPRRGLLRDGRLVVNLHHMHRAIEGIDGRAKRHARLNQKLYGAVLAVPLGITTRVPGHDDPGDGTGDVWAAPSLQDRIAALAAGRVEVVTLLPEREPVVPTQRVDHDDRDAAPATPITDPSWDRAGGTVGTDSTDGTDGTGDALGTLDTETRVVPEAPAPAALADPTYDRSAAPAPSRAPFAPVAPARSPEPEVVPGRRPRWRRRPASEPAAPPVEGVQPLGESVADVPVDTDAGSGDPAGGVRGPAPVLPAARSSKVRAIARLGEPVAPLVIEDFEPHPAYDPVIGPDLAAARTRVGLSVDELAERTRIRPHVIESIEVDDFTPCGGDFYARGHIRTLARVLGKDPAPMLAAFENRYATAPISPRRVFEAELATGLTGSMRSTSGGANWTLLVASVLALVLVWSAVRLFSVDDEAAFENPPPVLNGSAGLTSGFSAPEGPTAPQTVVTKVAAVQSGASVTVRDGDGEVVFEGDLVIGEVTTVDAVPPVTVSTDDGGAVSVEVAGQDEGFLGQVGQAATRVFQAPAD